MEVTTVEEQSVSLRAVLRYAVPTVAFVALLNAPALISPTYTKVLKTVILLIVVAMMGRLLVSALVSFKRPRTPPEIDDGAALPSVSVVVPAYNEASVLPDTIAACRDLEYPEEKLEVVLCYETDSTDRTAEICETAAAGDSIFEAVPRDEPGGGKAAACNYAFGYASGEIIASIDADHEFAPDAVRRAVRWFHHDDDVWCVKGRCYGKNPTDSLLSLHATLERHVDELADLYGREVVNGYTIFGGGQAFFRREAFEELGEFDEEVLVEDIDFSTRIHLAGKEIRVDPGIITYEEHPPTFSALWSQRKRWARGWLQVSARYLGQVAHSSEMPLSRRTDAVFTFAFTLALPFLVVGVPLPAVDLLTAVASSAPTPTAYVPHSRVIWTALGTFPLVMAGSVFLQDYWNGHEHHPTEYLASLTLGAFFFVQSLFYAIGFLEEWLFRDPSVYITTARAEEDDAFGVADVDGPGAGNVGGPGAGDGAGSVVPEAGSRVGLEEAVETDGGSEEESPDPPTIAE